MPQESDCPLLLQKKKLGRSCKNPTPYCIRVDPAGDHTRRLPPAPPLPLCSLTLLSTEQANMLQSRRHGAGVVPRNSNTQHAYA